MKRHNSEPGTVPNRESAPPTPIGSSLTWQSSSSFGSTASDVRRADKVFDQIEDLLIELMADTEQRRLHCRTLECQLSNEEPRQVFTAVVIITPPVIKP